MALYIDETDVRNGVTTVVKPPLLATPVSQSPPLKPAEENGGDMSNTSETITIGPVMSKPTNRTKLNSFYERSRQHGAVDTRARRIEQWRTFIPVFRKIFRRYAYAVGGSDTMPTTTTYIDEEDGDTTTLAPEGGDGGVAEEVKHMDEEVVAEEERARREYERTQLRQQQLSVLSRLRAISATLDGLEQRVYTPEERIARSKAAVMELANQYDAFDDDEDGLRALHALPKHALRPFYHLDELGVDETTFKLIAPPVANGKDMVAVDDGDDAGDEQQQQPQQPQDGDDEDDEEAAAAPAHVLHPVVLPPHQDTAMVMTFDGFCQLLLAEIWKVLLYEKVPFDVSGLVSGPKAYHAILSPVNMSPPSQGEGTKRPKLSPSSSPIVSPFSSPVVSGHKQPANGGVAGGYNDEGRTDEGDAAGGDNAQFTMAASLTAYQIERAKALWNMACAIRHEPDGSGNDAYFHSLLDEDDFIMLMLSRRSPLVNAVPVEYIPAAQDALRKHIAEKHPSHLEFQPSDLLCARNCISVSSVSGGRDDSHKPQNQCIVS